jgi:hypothetical protein
MDQQLVRYRSFVADNARWDGFVLRPDDIVISTPPKCGTTWTQMICALLIFQTTELHQPLDEISIWLDMVTRTRDDVIASLDAQTHRRFIKTHTPLDGVPWDDRVTYICVGRDPRDVALSWDNHMDNMDINALLGARATAVGLDDMAEFFPDGPPNRPERDIDRFWSWVDEDDPNVNSGLRATLHHFTKFLAARELPNVVVLHYDDLKADLDGQMHMLAGRLGIAVDEARWPALIAAATFENMKARATEVAPEVSNALWQSVQQFFHRGTSGQWRELIDEEGLRRYFERASQLAAPDVVAWAHHSPAS